MYTTYINASSITLIDSDVMYLALDSRRGEDRATGEADFLGATFLGEAFFLGVTTFFGDTTFWTAFSTLMIAADFLVFLMGLFVFGDFCSSG